MDKKKFELSEIEVIKFDEEDVITSSQGSFGTLKGDYSNGLGGLLDEIKNI